MKKRLVLKKKIQNLLFVGAMIGGLVLCVYGLNALDKHEYNRAIEKCDASNIVERYTNQGDIYYQCKVEK